MKIEEKSTAMFMMVTLLLILSDLWRSLRVVPCDVLYAALAEEGIVCIVNKLIYQKQCNMERQILQTT